MTRGVTRRLGEWLPLLLFVAVIAAVYPMRLVMSWEPPLLLPTVNIVVFITASLLIAGLAATAFAEEGSLMLLLLGAGMLVFGLGGVLGAYLLSYLSVDAGIATHDVASLLAGALLVVTALLPARFVRSRKTRWRAVAVTNAVCVVGALLTAALAVRGRLPAFVTATGDSTSVRDVVLFGAAVLFIVAAALFAAASARHEKHFLELLFLGLALIGTGLIAVGLAVVGVPLSWIGRMAQDVGQIYVAGAVISAMRDGASAEKNGGRALARSFKRMEAALQAAEAKADELLRHAPAGIYEIDLETQRFVSVNQAMCRMTGYTSSELLEMDPYRLLDEESGASMQERIAKALAGEDEPAQADYSVVRKDGRRFYLSVMMRFERDEVGRVVKAFAIAHDVTGRRRAEAEIERARDEAQRQLNVRTALQETAQLALTSLKPDVLAQRAVEDLQTRFGLRAASVWLLGSNGSHLYHAAQTGFEASIPPLPLDADSAAVLTFNSGLTGVCEDTGAEGVPETSREILGRLGEDRKSYVIVRLETDAECLGVLAMVWPTPRALPSEDVGMYEAIAAGLALGLHHARLVDSQRVRRHRIEVLHELMQVALSSLDVQASAQRVIEHLVDRYHLDFANLWLDDGTSLELVAAVGYPPSYRHLSPMPLSAPFDEPKAFRSGHPVTAVEPTNASVLKAYEEMGLELGSYAVLPLIARGRPIGTLSLAWKTVQDLNAWDVEFYRSVAAEIAVVLENAMLFNAEHKMAETLQDTLVAIPAHVSGVAYSRAYESATYETGRVGGDFVDIFEVGRRSVGIVLGDVSGKGLDAAVVTSLVRNTIRAHAIDRLSPAEVCDKTNRVMHRFTDVDAYVTLFFGVLDTKTGRLRYVAAGHPPALVLGTDGSLRELDGGSNPILGAFKTVRLEDSEAVLRRGERLVAYSDGITEARSPRGGGFYSLDGLERCLRGHGEARSTDLARLVMDDVVAFSQGVLRDDAAVLVVEPTRVPQRVEGAQLRAFDDDVVVSGEQSAAAG